MQLSQPNKVLRTFYIYSDHSNVSLVFLLVPSIIILITDTYNDAHMYKILLVVWYMYSDCTLVLWSHLTYCTTLHSRE